MPDGALPAVHLLERLMSFIHHGFRLVNIWKVINPLICATFHLVSSEFLHPKGKLQSKSP